MTKYELWTLNSKTLLLSYRNAVRGEMEGKPNAAKAMEVFGGEILRRIKMLEVEEWEA